jgi:hypothetical protein
MVGSKSRYRVVPQVAHRPAWVSDLRTRRRWARAAAAATFLAIATWTGLGVGSFLAQRETVSGRHAVEGPKLSQAVIGPAAAAAARNPI